MRKSAINYYKYLNLGIEGGFIPMFTYEKATKVYRGVEYVHGFYIYDGIVIGERTGYAQAFIDGFFDGVEGNVGRHHHDHIRPNRALEGGRQLNAMAARYHAQLAKALN